MKILFTGGGSGGHFYPIIAVADEIRKIAKEEHLVAPRLYFMSDSPYDQNLLLDKNIVFKKIYAGKMRRYFSLLNLTDTLKTGVGILKALFEVFRLYPDVIFGKGGYASFPVLLAGKILRIPVVIHESDSVPGRVNLWAGKFADRVAVSYPEAGRSYPSEKTACVGNPVRPDLIPDREGSLDALRLERGVPVIFIMGGSLGAEIINETLISALPELVSKYQIIHQTGRDNLKDTEGVARVILKDNPFKDRYRPLPYLGLEAMKYAAGAADIIISRAGSAIFEIASWGVPSIIIPITDSNGDHQRKNAWTYARSGACSVIEESNLSDSVLVAEINRLMDNPDLRKKMSESAKKFATPDAGRKIARVILDIALAHES